ncbi:superoxide dismutase, Ni [bacterium]|nr:superoxide dismutase, Ni [bacterium]
MKKRILIAIFAVFSLMIAAGALMNAPQTVQAHCQMPCGIYDDPGRFASLAEHITTLDKSITMINDLADKEGALNANQLTRWVINKDATADEFAEIITYYFLQQRIKPTEAKSGAEFDSYVKKVTLCHEMLVTSMKIKQTNDAANTKHLSELLEAFHTAYTAK